MVGRHSDDIRQRLYHPKRKKQKVFVPRKGVGSTALTINFSSFLSKSVRQPQATLSEQSEIERVPRKGVEPL
jgi:hypothetical protein